MVFVLMGKKNEQVTIFQMSHYKGNLDSDMSQTYFMRISDAEEQMEIEFCFCLPLIRPICSLVCFGCGVYLCLCILLRTVLVLLLMMK